MPLYRPSELGHFLRSLDRGAKRTLSQNFLVDGNVVRQIVTAVNIPVSGTVVEIGSGPGVLTEAFLEKGYAIIAIEKDVDFSRTLGRLDPTGRKLVSVLGDVLEFSLTDYRLKRDQTVVVSNVPYHITTPILHWMCQQRSSFCQALLMMQKEVAEKFMQHCASYTQFKVSLFFDVYSVCKVSKHCFAPAPNVDSEVLSFTAKKNIPLPEDRMDELLGIVCTCFMHRRKTVIASLSRYYDRSWIGEGLEASGISIHARPEELRMDEWVSVLKRLIENPAG